MVYGGYTLTVTENQEGHENITGLIGTSTFMLANPMDSKLRCSSRKWQGYFRLHTLSNFPTVIDHTSICLILIHTFRAI